jgi:glutamyl-tRNA synthetase
LHSASAPHRGERYIYAGTCRDASGEELEARRRSGRKPASRLRIGAGSVSFVDGIQGPFCQDMERECGDVIIRRSDGVFAYQLAVVVDDLFQGVNQVVRGCDLLDSTPQQIRIRSMLAPESGEVSYWHVPLMLDARGRRLSKRDRDQGLDGALAHFASVEAFIGHVAWLSGLREVNEPITMEGLVTEFSLDSLKGKTALRWVLPD